MAYTPVKTWADGETIDAADILAESDSLREYVEKLADNALSGSTIVNTEHIMKGQYIAPINQAHMVSGIWQGHVFHMDATDYTYATIFNTGRLGDNIEAVIPLTALTVEARHPATLFYQWNIHGIGRQNHDLNYAGTCSLYPFIGNPTLPDSNHATIILEEDSVTANWPEKEFRYPASGHYLKNDFGPATTSVGMMAKAATGMAKVQFIAWQVSVELFYL